MEYGVIFWNCVQVIWKTESNLSPTMEKNQKLNTSQTLIITTITILISKLYSIKNHTSI